MKLLDIITGHWAILPEALVEIQAIYATHLRGEKIDIAAVEARLGRQLASEQQAYELRPGGVAVLQATGVMAPKANLMMQISGGVSTQMLARQFDSMAADSRVQSVVFVPDSPGGNALAVPTATRALANLAAAKPTVTVVQGVMASAMYWVGSAANQMFIDGETDIVGSIGVIQRVSWDAPSATQRDFVRGQYKRASHDGVAPSAEFIAQVDSQLDYLYGLFVDTVAAHRGTSSEMVLEHMADGRVFVGQQAINAGLVDGVSTVEAMVEAMASNPGRYAKRRQAQFAMPARPSASASAEASLLSSSAGAAPTDDITHPEKGNVMSDALSRESLQRDHAALFATLQQDFTTAGATAERDRIQAVLAQGALLPGHTALVQRLAFDGKTTGPEAAMAIVAAEAQARNAHATAHAEDAPKPVATSAPPADTPAEGASKAELAAQAKALAQKDGIPFLSALKQLSGIA